MFDLAAEKVLQNDHYKEDKIHRETLGVILNVKKTKDLCLH